MTQTYDVLIVGAGAAGLAAGRRLATAGAAFRILEARDRIGGRALTEMHDGLPIDIGCGWLHSAERNVWREQAERLGFHVDQTPAPWQRQFGGLGFTPEEQAAFGAAFARFEARIHGEAENCPVCPASAFLEPASRWTPMLNAVFSYISGAELDLIDARDYERYEDTGLNWRLREGYGALIKTFGADLPVELSTPVTAIDHSGADRLRIVTARGALEARTLIVAAPTTLLPGIDFRPGLPAIVEAAGGLPLGFAEKLYFAVAEPEVLPADGHLFGHIDRVETCSYHLRPLGRPIVEVYFGGALARRVGEAGTAAMADFALQELSDLLGASIRNQLTPIAASHWAADPFARGSYSYARPGYAEARAVLARGAEERIFFAGEACSRGFYSTAHGAYETGVVAADQALAALGRAA